MNAPELPAMPPSEEPRPTNAMDGTMSPAQKSSVDRILQTASRIPHGQMIFMLLDGKVTSAEARAALEREGLPRDEIDAGLEDARREVEKYLKQVVTPEELAQFRKGVGAELQDKVMELAKMIGSGTISDVTNAQRATNVTALDTPGMESSEEEKKL